MKKSFVRGLLVQQITSQLRGGKRGLRLRVKLLQVGRVPRVPPFPAAFHLPRLLGADSFAKGIDEASEEGLSTAPSV